VPNYYAIKAKEVSPEILSTSTKPYYIPFHNTSSIRVHKAIRVKVLYIGLLDIYY